jgi:hypothetical protein
MVSINGRRAFRGRGCAAGTRSFPSMGIATGWGAFTRHPQLGFSFAAYQKLWRLAGVDQCTSTASRSKFWEPDDLVIASARSCLADVRRIAARDAGVLVRPRGQARRRNIHAQLQTRIDAPRGRAASLGHPDGVAARRRQHSTGMGSGGGGVSLEDYARHASGLAAAIVKFGQAHDAGLAFYGDDFTGLVPMRWKCWRSPGCAARCSWSPESGRRWSASVHWMRSAWRRQPGHVARRDGPAPARDLPRIARARLLPGRPLTESCSTFDSGPGIGSYRPRDGDLPARSFRRRSSPSSRAPRHSSAIACSATSLHVPRPTAGCSGSTAIPIMSVHSRHADGRKRSCASLCKQAKLTIDNLPSPRWTPGATRQIASAYAGGRPSRRDRLRQRHGRAPDRGRSPAGPAGARHGAALRGGLFRGPNTRSPSGGASLEGAPAAQGEYDVSRPSIALLAVLRQCFQVERLASLVCWPWPPAFARDSSGRGGRSTDDDPQAPAPVPAAGPRRPRTAK